MNAFTHHFGFEFRSGVRNKTLLLMNYLFPLGFYLMMGLIMTEINPLFQQVLIPAMVTFAVLAATLLGIPDPLVNARENGIFRTYKINGVPAVSILIIPALTTMAHMILIAVIITSTAAMFFDAPLPSNWVNYGITFLAITTASAGLSILIGVIAKTSRLTVLWSQVFFVPSMILGGLMLPFEMLPEGAQKIAMMMPATHAMNAFNGLAMGTTAGFSPWGSIAVLYLGGLMALGLAVYLFRWDGHNTESKRPPLLALLAIVPYLIGLFVL